jgi:hypothetical protein
MGHQNQACEISEEREVGVWSSQESCLEEGVEEKRL